MWLTFTVHLSSLVVLILSLSSSQRKRAMSLYKEDVYESEDPPDTELTKAEEEFESEELEKVHLSMGLARKRFDNCMLNSEGADFSDSVGARRLKRGFKANEIFEAEPAGSEEEETLEQRYNRLTQEVKKLAAEVEKQQNDVTTVKREDICALDNLLKYIASRCKNGQQTVNKGISEVGRD